MFLHGIALIMFLREIASKHYSMNIHLPASTFSEVLPALAQGLLAPLDSWNGETIIKVPSAVGRGAISAVRFYDGLSLLCWQVDLNEAITMNVAPTDHHPLRLMLCTQGSVDHAIDADRLYQLTSHHCSLSVCSGHVDQHFSLPAHQSLRLYMVEIDRAVFESRVHFPPGDGHHSLAPIFFDTFAPDPFLYRSAYNNLIGAALQALEESRFQGLARHTFLEAKTLELLSLALQQYVER